ncbi:MAG: hypothetical protein ACRCX2_39100 [Paraclostridium sp.]
MATAPLQIYVGNPIRFDVQTYHRYSDVIDFEVVIDTSDGSKVIAKASKNPKTGYKQSYITGATEFNVHIYIPKEDVAAVIPPDGENSIDTFDKSFFISIKYSANDTTVPGGVFYYENRASFADLIR